MTAMLKGVYIPADSQFPKHLHGIGMRIEAKWPSARTLRRAQAQRRANAPKEVWCRLGPTIFRNHFVILLVLLLRLFVFRLVDCCVVSTDRGCRGRMAFGFGLF